MHREILAGGGVNEVLRVGVTVHRPTGSWSPAVHELLRHLRARGFTASPAVHGVTDDGLEILDFLPGEVGNYPATPAAATAPANPDGFGTAEEQARRARLFCDRYGLDAADRTSLVDTIIARLHALVNFMHAQAAIGDAAFAGHLAGAHHLHYLADAAYLNEQRAVFDRRLSPGGG